MTRQQVFEPATFIIRRCYGCSWVDDKRDVPTSLMGQNVCMRYLEEHCPECGGRMVEFHYRNELVVIGG